MEYSVIFAFLLIELIAGIYVFTYWLRHRSGLDTAKAEFARAVKEHYMHGTLDEYVQAVAGGKESIRQQGAGALRYLSIPCAGLLGLIVVYFMKDLAWAGAWLRAIVGIVAMFPFVALLAIVIAQEADSNKIADFEKASATQLQEQIKAGTIDELMSQLE